MKFIFPYFNSYTLNNAMVIVFGFMGGNVNALCITFYQSNYNYSRVQTYLRLISRTGIRSRSCSSLSSGFLSCSVLEPPCICSVLELLWPLLGLEQFSFFKDSWEVRRDLSFCSCSSCSFCSSLCSFSCSCSLGCRSFSNILLNKYTVRQGQEETERNYQSL